MGAGAGCERRRERKRQTATTRARLSSTSGPRRWRARTRVAAARDQRPPGGEQKPSAASSALESARETACAYPAGRPPAPPAPSLSKIAPPLTHWVSPVGESGSQVQAMLESPMLVDPSPHCVHGGLPVIENQPAMQTHEVPDSTSLRLRAALAGAARKTRARRARRAVWLAGRVRECFCEGGGGVCFFVGARGPPPPEKTQRPIAPIAPDTRRRLTELDEALGGGDAARHC